MELKKAALEVLLHNLHGPYFGLPRTAGWGYPEPYTRDLMISALGMLASNNNQLVEGLQRVLQTLAQNQSPLGHIHSLVHDPTDGGASDTTPLFLIALALFRKQTGQPEFLAEAAEKAVAWLAYQSPDDAVMVAHMPTSDWRDEEWVWGYGLYVNTLVYACLKLYGQEERALKLFTHIIHAGFREIQEGFRIHEGLALVDKPYYAHWVYKIHISKRFDLLGNSLAILLGLANHARAEKIINWVEMTIQEMQVSGSLVCDLPPCLLPFILPQDEDWHPRYRLFNLPGEYHNGGIWPFISGLYITALVSAGEQKLAEKKLASLEELVRPARDQNLHFGFNEWLHASDCKPRGQDWQTWSAAMTFFAADCVEKQRVPFFEDFRETGMPV